MFGSVDGDTKPQLSDVRVRRRRSHGEPIPKRSEADIPANPNVYPQPEHNADPRVSLSEVAQRPKANAAGNEESGRSGWIDAQPGVQRTNDYIGISSGPPRCAYPQ